MPKIITPLTDTQIKKSKAKEKQYKISDGGGLCLIITPKGSKYFRFDYTYNKKRKSISFGVYPSCTLKEARARREESKELIKEGIDPSLKRKIEKNIQTFEEVANKWLELSKDDWAEVTHRKAIETINKNTTSIREIDMSKITRLDILSILEVMQEREVFVLANRLLGYLDRIWKYAVTYNIVEHNIIADIDRRHALKRKSKNHYPAVTKEEDIKILMHDIREYKMYKTADISTIYAFLLAPYIFRAKGKIWGLKT
jgi:hypothetical protein